jgi:hypothetical protein|tara:strand:- start:2918 stop:3448 length:531 start_codon:yes stop_codon:yes gene_type:complete
MTKGNDILISFSYEYPMDGKDLKMDFSLMYQDDALMLKIKSGSKNLGTFPVTMFSEVLEFLSSKGYANGLVEEGGNEDMIDSCVSKNGNGVEGILNMMSSDNSVTDQPSVPVEEKSDNNEGSSPVQSFSVNTKEPSDGEPVSVNRFRDDINYVDPESSSVSTKKSPIKGTSIKRTT